MLVTRFPYAQLTRETIDGKRLYACPDGLNLASVTTILSATATEEKKNGLENWRKRVGYAKAEAITKEAGSRGTAMHVYLEEYILTGAIKPPGTNPFKIKSHNMALEIVKYGLSHVSQFFGSEVYLYYSPFYAGATDVVAEYKGELAILDFKQSDKIKQERYLDDYRCQLVGYAAAHDHLYGTDIKRCVNMICTKDLVYQEFEVNKNNFNKYEDMWWNKVEQYYQMEHDNGK